MEWQLVRDDLRSARQYMPLAIPTFSSHGAAVFAASRFSRFSYMHDSDEEPDIETRFLRHNLHWE